MTRIRDHFTAGKLASVRAAGRTDVGRRRSINEDSLLARHPVFLVADGMGGHDHGDRASESVLAAFASLAGEDAATLADVERVIDSLPQTVLEAAGESGGTTLTGAVLVAISDVPYWYVLNVGDSRTYLARNGRLEQISVDHSLVQESIDAGIVSLADAATHPQRNIVTRALGVGDDSRVDSWLLPLERGQRLLICSDGLSGVVPADDIETVLLRESTVSGAASRLVDLALDRGAPDNVSAVVVEVDEVAHDGVGFAETGPGVRGQTIPRVDV